MQAHMVVELAKGRLAGINRIASNPNEKRLRMTPHVRAAIRSALFDVVSNTPLPEAVRREYLRVLERATCAS